MNSTISLWRVLYYDDSQSHLLSSWRPFGSGEPAEWRVWLRSWPYIGPGCPFGLLAPLSRCAVWRLLVICIFGEKRLRYQLEFWVFWSCLCGRFTIYIYMLAPPPGPTFWFLWVYAGLVTFHYQFFSCFLSICSFCTLLASKCSFWVSICRVLCIAGSQNHAFLASHAGFGEVQVTKPAEGMPFWSEQSSNLNRNPVLIFLLFYLTKE